MRGVIGTVMVCLLVAQSFVGAVEPSAGPASTAAPKAAPSASSDGVLKAAVAREAARLALAKGNSLRQPQPGGSPKRGWIGRHPALFGALVGAGAGAVFANTVENETFCRGTSNDCLFPGGNKTLVGAGMGAGIGALVGVIAGAARK